MIRNSLRKSTKRSLLEQAEIIEKIGRRWKGIQYHGNDGRLRVYLWTPIPMRLSNGRMRFISALCVQTDSGWKLCGSMQSKLRRIASNLIISVYNDRVIEEGKPELQLPYYDKRKVSPEFRSTLMKQLEKANAVLTGKSRMQAA